MVIPYLKFPGCCEEALKMYVSALGGEIYTLSRFTAATAHHPSLIGKVMHAEASVAGGAVAGSDSVSPDIPSGFELMVHFPSAAEADRAFDLLAEGGQALQRLTPHPPPDDGGAGAMLVDKFGIRWIVTAPNEQKK